MLMLIGVVLVCRDVDSDLRNLKLLFFKKYSEKRVIYAGKFKGGIYQCSVYSDSLAWVGPMIWRSNIT